MLLQKLNHCCSWVLSQEESDQCSRSGSPEGDSSTKGNFKYGKSRRQDETLTNRAGPLVDQLEKMKLNSCLTPSIQILSAVHM